MLPPPSQEEFLQSLEVADKYTSEMRIRERSKTVVFEAWLKRFSRRTGKLLPLLIVEEEEKRHCRQSQTLGQAKNAGNFVFRFLMGASWWNRQPFSLLPLFLTLTAGRRACHSL